MSAAPIAATPMQEIDYKPRLAGESYLTFLASIHSGLRPETYLEIGTHAGLSLALATCPSLAVDVAFKLNSDVIGKKEHCHLYQMSSDRFFRRFDPIAILGQPIDFAFLDGMHLFEYLIRDFANVERFCRPNSVVAVHDCIPPALLTTVRDPHNPLWKQGLYPDWWAGDVWKAIPLLQEHRPDLRITFFDAPPTGIVTITNLDPNSTVLTDRYRETVSAPELSGLMENEFNEFWDRVTLTSTRSVKTVEQSARLFWI